MKTSPLLFALLVLGSQARAGLLCENLLKPVPLRDSAVEIEISGTIIEKLFTTTDGTLGPVLDPLGAEALPPALLKTIQETYPGEALEKIPWDVLTGAEKSELILYATKAHQQNFFKNRSVQGLKYRDEFDLVFQEPSEFMGALYPPGKHRFKSQDVFGHTQIEFSGPKGMDNTLGFEIHLRRPDGADKNLISSTSLQKALVGYVSNVHQHIVAPIPLEALADNPALVSYQIMDLYRRVSLHAQLLRITRGHAIEELKASTGNYSYTNMPLLKKRDLEALHSHFLELGNYLKAEKIKTDSQLALKTGSVLARLKAATRLFLAKVGPQATPLENPLENRLARKSGLVGMRAGKVYDGDALLWGMELRDLAPSHDQKHLDQLLRAVQTRMLLGDFGLKNETVLQVLNETESPLMERIYYSYSRDLEVSHKEGPLQDPTGGKLAGQKNEALGMLLHHWEKDPLFIEHPEFLPKLEQARRIALESIQRGERPTEALARFAKRSGLQYLVWQSIKIE